MALTILLNLHHALRLYLSGDITLNPAINGGVVNIHAAFGQHLLQITIADAIFAVPVVSR